MAQLQSGVNGPVASGSIPRLDFGLIDGENKRVMFKRFNIPLICAAFMLAGCKTLPSISHETFSRFIGTENFSNFTQAESGKRERILLSPVIEAGMSWNELVISWNAEAEPGTFLRVEASAVLPTHQTKYYTLAKWSPDNRIFARTSQGGQEDTDGAVETDTLVLKQEADGVRVRLTLGGINGDRPHLNYLGLSFCNSKVHPVKHSANHAIWGRTISTPELSQQSYPQEKGWCSPTAVAMVMSHWAEQLGRRDMQVEVPEVAAGVYDESYAGTGNWPFNTAYAGSFRGMRGYVTRLDDISELEEWIEAGIPVVISAPWNLLQPGRAETGSGHLVVCTGFTTEGDVVVNDPATNLKRSRVRHIYKREDVARAWLALHNTAYLIYPMEAKIPEDRYRHWSNGRDN